MDSPQTKQEENKFCKIIIFHILIEIFKECEISKIWLLKHDLNNDMPM